MLNPDDLDPPKKAAKARDLTPMSVGELQDYIASLEEEIARAEAAITKKQAHRGAIDALFGGNKD